MALSAESAAQVLAPWPKDSEIELLAFADRMSIPLDAGTGLPVRARAEAAFTSLSSASSKDCAQKLREAGPAGAVYLELIFKNQTHQHKDIMQQLKALKRDYSAPMLAELHKRAARAHPQARVSENSLTALKAVVAQSAARILQQGAAAGAEVRQAAESLTDNLARVLACIDDSVGASADEMQAPVPSPTGAAASDEQRNQELGIEGQGLEIVPVNLL
ncbi:hypothetical protein WJX73_002950 [Symbiochloris irregularis]|uniref:Uncharacterized protein n=1 Tax=Symbiochloris irregularis TaxID=706552 RepID=A0AAW1Q1J5_9CHLO